MNMKINPDDPAYWMLEKGKREELFGAQHKIWRSETTVYSEGCYICEDPEFALMGLPLCYPCSKCGGHVPADDCVCDDCETDQRD